MKKSLFIFALLFAVSAAFVFAEERIKSEEKILVVYFSRYGNTNYEGKVDATTSASIVSGDKFYGTTEYAARLIQKNVGGDIHLIQTQAHYPSDFDTLVKQNRNEMQRNILPPLKKSDLKISKYDFVFIGFPVWAMNVPQAVLSFLNEYNLSGKTVIPFCTHDGYGAGSSFRTIENASKGATTLNGIAIHAKEASLSESAIKKWLVSIDFLK